MSKIILQAVIKLKIRQQFSSIILILFLKKRFSFFFFHILHHCVFFKNSFFQSQFLNEIQKQKKDYHYLIQSRIQNDKKNILLKMLYLQNFMKIFNFYFTNRKKKMTINNNNKKDFLKGKKK